MRRCPDDGAGAGRGGSRERSIGGMRAGPQSAGGSWTYHKPATASASTWAGRSPTRRCSTTPPVRFATPRSRRRPGTPRARSSRVLERLGVDLGEVRRFIHGVTIGTNSVLEGRGAEVWMLTTTGFRDVLEIARTNRTVLYDITARKPPPLVPRGRTLEIDERMSWDGEILSVPLDLDQARATVESLPGRSGGRGVFPPQLREPPPRAGGGLARAAGVQRRSAARGVRHRFERGASGIPGVRALQHHCPQRLYRSPHRRLSRPASGVSRESAATGDRCSS